MDLGLIDKVIVLAGGKKSLKKDFLRVFSGEGAIVVILGGNLSDNQNLQSEIAGAGENVFLIETELNDPNDCKKAIEVVIQKYGRIEGLVNNSEANIDAGFGANDNKRFLQNIQEGLAGYYLITHYALPFLKNSKGPIVNISFETLLDNTPAEAAVNGGISALTREWAVELLKYGIRVNALVTNEKTAEVCNAAAFLLSEKSSHTTGQLIRMDGE
jgi:L-fucose dehydrogenase